MCNSRILKKLSVELNSNLSDVIFLHVQQLFGVKGAIVKKGGEVEEF